MSHPLLLQSSYIFDNSSTIDDIRQSYIDLHKETIQKEVQILLKRAILSFDNDIKLELASELFQLILTCFSCYPKQFIPAFESLFKRSKTNSNYLICTVSVLSYLTRIAKCLSISDYSLFVTDAINELIPQIKISNPITIYEQKIPSQFQLDFITNLLLCSNLTSESVSVLFPLVFSDIKNSFKKPSLEILLNDAFSAGLENFLPESIINNKEFFLNLDVELIGMSLHCLSSSVFNDLFDQIDEIFCNAKELSSKASMSFIMKCKENDKKVKSISSLVKFLNASDLTQEVCEYLKEYDFLIPNEVLNRFIGIEDHELLFKIVSDPSYLPPDLFKEGLFNSKNIDICIHYVESQNASSSILMSKDFILHVYSILSECKNEKIPLFVKIFTDYLSRNNLNNLFDEIVFSETYPPTFKHGQLLSSVFQSLSQKYVNIYIQKDHMKKMINEILTRRTIPTFLFLNLFLTNAAYDYLQTNNLQNNVLMQSIVAFSNLSTLKVDIKRLDEITILPPNSESYQIMQQMIESSDKNLFSSLNNESLSLFNAAICYIKNRYELKINGLTKDNIFQFIYLLFDFVNLLSFEEIFFPDNLYLTKNMLKLFKEEVIYFSQNESKNIQKWINLFFATKVKKNDILQFFVDYNVQQITDFFIDTIIESGFSANKEFIVDLLSKKRNNSISTIKCVINSLSFDDYKSFQVKNKFYADSKELSKIISNNINNNDSSVDFICRNIFYVINNMCLHENKIEIKKKYNFRKALFQIVEEEIITKNKEFRDLIISNNLFSVYQDIIYQHELNKLSKIHEETNLDKLLTSILECQSLETNDILLEKLFNYMINDKSNMIGYLMTYLEMSTTNQEIDAIELLNKYVDEYCIYGDYFIKAINKIMLLDVYSKKFVFCSEYPKIENSIEFNSLIHRLLESLQKDSDNFNPFICLKSIMCTFPFLLEDPKEFFDAVFVALDNYSLIFDDKNSNKSKTAISALSFLLSSLNINKFTDSFIEYAFSNISNFSNCQIFCLNICLLSIIQIPVIKKLLISKLIKYNFLEIAISMIKRDVPDGHFKDSYYSIIYFILDSYFSIMNKLNQRDPLIMNTFEDMKDLFSHYFDDHISRAFPYQIKLNQTNLLKLLDIKINDELLSFISNIEKIRSFWFVDKQNSRLVTSEIMKTFIDKCHKPIEKASYKSRNNYALKRETNNAIQYLLKQKTWAFDWIVSDKMFHAFPEHYNYLKEVFKNIPKKTNYNFDPHKYLNDHYCNETFIKEFISDELLFEKFRKVNLYEMIEFLLTNLNKERISKCFINCVTNILSSNNISTEQLIELIIILEIYLRKSEKENISEKLLISILDISMEPQNRNNQKLLNCLVKLLSLYPKLPDYATQIVNFIYLNNSDDHLFIEALKLTSKFSSEVVNKYLLLQNVFDKEIKKEDPSIKLINYFNTFAPDVFSTRSPELCDFLENLFKKCEIQSNYLSNDLLTDIIIKIINLICPKRNLSCSFISDSTQNQFTEVNRVPRRIYELFPKFFDTFMNNKKYINKILLSKGIVLEKFVLYKSFPELIDFQVRFENFQKQVHSKIKNSTKYLNISPDLILADSFDQLKKASTDTWKCTFKINYHNQSGVDMGGLRRDWFTKLARELFNPSTGFFHTSGEKLCLQPDPLSSKYQNYQSYFVFAGKFIARAIMEKLCVNVHFTRSFLKQILGHPLRISDLDSIDEQIRQSLEYIRKNNFDENDLEFYFEVTDCMDKYKTFELIPNGSNIKITNKNKDEYVNLAMQYYLKNSMLKQIESFCQGFNSLIPHDEIKSFSPIELNLIIAGIPEIDINDFKENVHSRYDRNSKVFNLFFECISKWNNIDLAKLLMFITGSSQVPPNGFKHFANTGNPITIAKVDNKSSLPVAHTCFNTIDLPPYDTLQQMDEKLRYAINECDGFLLL